MVSASLVPGSGRVGRCSLLKTSLVCFADALVWSGRIQASIRDIALVPLASALEHDLDQTGYLLRHGIGKGLIKFRHGLDFERLHAHPSGDIRPLQIRITEIQQRQSCWTRLFGLRYSVAFAGEGKCLRL